MFGNQPPQPPAIFFQPPQIPGFLGGSGGQQQQNVNIPIQKPFQAQMNPQTMNPQQPQFQNPPNTNFPIQGPPQFQNPSNANFPIQGPPPPQMNLQPMNPPFPPPQMNSQPMNSQPPQLPQFQNPPNANLPGQGPPPPQMNSQPTNQPPPRRFSQPMNPPPPQPQMNPQPMNPQPMNPQPMNPQPFPPPQFPQQMNPQPPQFQNPPNANFPIQGPPPPQMNSQPTNQPPPRRFSQPMNPPPPQPQMNPPFSSPQFPQQMNSQPPQLPQFQNPPNVNFSNQGPPPQMNSQSANQSPPPQFLQSANQPPFPQPQTNSQPMNSQLPQFQNPPNVNLSNQGSPPPRFQQPTNQSPPPQFQQYNTNASLSIYKPPSSTSISFDDEAPGYEPVNELTNNLSNFLLSNSVSFIDYEKSINMRKREIDQLSEEEIKTKAWDPAVFMEVYNKAEKEAREENPTDAWRNPKPTAVRLFLGRSTELFLKYGMIKQIIRTSQDDARDCAILSREEIRCDTGGLVGDTKREDKINPIIGKRVFKTTEVAVVNQDCLEVVRKLQESYPQDKVVCLNMANAMTPGGGWRRGRLAQEESIFYRTALSQSLENEKYPIGNYTCIVTRDVTVIRDDVDKGFRFKHPDERWKLNFITMAAFKLNNVGEFTTEMAIKTRAKIEALFAICANEGMEHLVLSALGCGAFKNPPDYIADIFREVMLQFAGFFKTIYFAIKDKKRGANVITFSQKLVDPSITVLDDNECTRPRIIENDLSMNVIPSTNVEMSICRYGGECTNDDEEHNRRFAHPPMCPFGKDCKCTENHHRQLFTHPKPCKHADSCEIMYLKDQEEITKHEQRYFHLEKCMYGSKCEHIGDVEHRKQFMHPPDCPDGKTCERIKDPEHASMWSHYKNKPCKFGLNCPYFAIPKHMEMYEHLFKPLCPNISMCEDESADHLREFSHICTNYPNCTSRDENHLKMYRHLALPRCKDGNECTDFSEHHLSCFCHPSVKYPRKPCTVTNCHYKDDVHRRNCIHYPIGQNDIPIQSVLPRMFYNSNFSRNTADLQGYLSQTGQIEEVLKSELGIAVRKLVHNARPVINASDNFFRLTNMMGCLYSAQAVLDMFCNPIDVRDCPAMQDIIRRGLREPISELAERLKDLAYNSVVAWNKSNIGKLKIPTTNDRNYLIFGRKQVTEAANKVLTTPIQQDPQEIATSLNQYAISDVLEELSGFCREISDIMLSVINEYYSEPGTLSSLAVYLGSTIQGFVGFAPNYVPTSSGRVLILKQNILAHKDAVILPCNTQWFLENKHREVRPWFRYEGGNHQEAIQQSALSLNNPKIYDLIAFELIVRASIIKRQPIGALRFDEFLEVMKGSFNPTFFTVHLPYKIPNSYIEEQGQFSPSRTPWDIAYEIMDNYPPTGDVVGTTFKIPAPINSGPGAQNQIHLCPVQIPIDEQNAYIYFTAYGELAIHFNSTNNSQMHISINGNKVSVEVQGCESQSDSEFNSMCNPYYFVSYMVHLNYSEGYVTVKHYDSSEIFSGVSLRTKIPPNLRYCNIGVSGTSEAIISNLFTGTEDLSLKLVEPKASEQSSNYYSESRHNLGRSHLPICDNALNCQIAYNEKSRGHDSHIRERRHFCRFDKATCKFISNEEHCRNFIHIEQGKVCQYGSGCRYLNDIEHRLTFKHEGLPWLLLQCMNGSKCNEKNDINHKIKFAHEKYSYETRRKLLEGVKY